MRSIQIVVGRLANYIMDHTQQLHIGGYRSRTVQAVNKSSKWLPIA